MLAPGEEALQQEAARLTAAVAEGRNAAAFVLGRGNAGTESVLHGGASGAGESDSKVMLRCSHVGLPLLLCTKLWAAATPAPSPSCMAALAAQARAAPSSACSVALPPLPIPFFVVLPVSAAASLFLRTVAV